MAADRRRFWETRNETEGSFHAPPVPLLRIAQMIGEDPIRDATLDQVVRHIGYSGIHKPGHEIGIQLRDRLSLILIQETPHETAVEGLVLSLEVIARTEQLSRNVLMQDLTLIS